MTVLATYTLTLNDDDGMTAEQASRLMNQAAAYVDQRIGNDENVHTMPITYADKAITVTAT
jgi:hypothetical protein